MTLKLVKSSLRKKPRKIGYVWSPERWENSFHSEDRKAFAKCDFVFHDTFDEEPDRRQYKKMFKTLRKGDTLVVSNLHHLESELGALLDTICTLQARGIYLQVTHNFIDTTTDINHGVFRVCDALLGFLENS